MAGYNNFSKSNNAIDAELNDRYPLSIACKVLAKKLNWSQMKAKSFLLTIGTNEYHHTSCKYNITDYYDISDDFINDYKIEIDKFEYKPAPKKAPTNYFKCWNFEDNDCRKWDFKLTNRIGNYTHDLKSVREKIQLSLKDLKNEQHTHKTKIRIQQEKIAVYQDILNQINKLIFE